MPNQKIDRIKHRYLWQFAVTLILFLLIPIILFFLLVVNTSYREMLAKSQNAYTDITGSLSMYVRDELYNMRLRAADFAIQSRIGYADVFSTPVLQQDPYYYRAAITNLAGMFKNPYNNYDIYLYYRDLGHVYSATTKLNRDDYIDRMANHSQDAVQKLNDFLDYPPDVKMTIISTFNELRDKSAAMYIGLPVRIGSTYADGMLIFAVSYDNIDISKFTTRYADLIRLFILNENNEVIFCNNPEPEFTLDAKEIEKLLDSQDAGFSNATHTFFASKIPISNLMYDWPINRSSSLNCIIAVANNAFQNESLPFYNTIIKGTIYVLAILMLLTGITIYVNYYPINRLIKRIGGHVSGNMNEMKIIENAVFNLEIALKEKEEVVAECIAGNLLYGIPIPQKTRLTGLLDHEGPFFLAVAEKMSGAKIQETVTGLIGDKSQIYSFPMPRERFTAIICPVAKDAVLSASMNEKTEGNAETINSMFACEIACSLNEIHLSFQNCLSRLKYRAAESSAESRQKLTEDILVYIQENFTNPLFNQSMVADKFGLSTYALSRFFKENLKIGFLDYTTNIRIEQAKKLLLTTEMNITAISRAVGIMNTNYFSRYFRSNCGMTPIMYRETRRREKQD